MQRKFLPDEVLQEFPQLNQFTSADTSARAEHDSLCTQTGHFSDPQEPFDKDTYERATQRILRNYPRSNPPEDLTDDLILQLFETEIKMLKTPGRPFHRLNANTNQQVYDNLKQVVIDEVRRLYTLYSQNDPPGNPIDLLVQGWTYGTQATVKNEAHKKTKANEDKWRLIDAFNLSEQIFDKWLYNKQNKIEIALVNHIPSKIGLDNTDLLNVKEFIDSVPQPVAGGDVSAYDFKVSNRNYAADADHRIRLMNNPSPNIINIVRRRHFVVSRAPVILSNGRIYIFKNPYKMKSGWSNTSSTNSKQRVFMGYMIDVPWIVAAGDDDLETPDPASPAKYEELGMKLKQFDIFENEFEFCGHTFYRDGTVKFNNVDKAIYNLFKGEFTPDRLEGIKFAMRNQPEQFQEIVRKLIKVSHHLR